MVNTSATPPPNWGSDDITKYIDACRQNQYATFANKNSVTLLKRVDKCFRKVLDKPINPRPFFPIQFLHRAHSSFLAACGLAMAGQTFEVNALLRLSLESAAYGFYINNDQSRAKLWLSRHDGVADMKKVLKEFHNTKIREHIVSNAPKLAAIFYTLYERAIDYGAHPNERGFSSSTTITEKGDHTEFLQIYLQEDGIQLDLALKTTAQVGVWALSIFQLIYPAKWELLGIKHELVELRSHL